MSGSGGLGPVPLRLAVGGFDLQTLTAADLDEDYAAVVESVDLLAGLFGDDWPVGLTRDEDLRDLLWHEDETRTGRSFAWVVRDADGRYVGCAYLKPVPGGEGWFAPYWFRVGFSDAAAIGQFDVAWREVMGAIVGGPVEAPARSAIRRD